MKKLLPILLLAASASVSAADLNVILSVGDPGYYGVISEPRPVVVYEEPVIVHRTRVVAEPVYLRVPPGHAKNWDKHCGRYNACQRPVYFVDEGWYETTYHERRGKGGKHKH